MTYELRAVFSFAVIEGDPARPCPSASTRSRCTQRCARALSAGGGWFKRSCHSHTTGNHRDPWRLFQGCEEKIRAWCSPIRIWEEIYYFWIILFPLYHSDTIHSYFIIFMLYSFLLSITVLFLDNSWLLYFHYQKRACHLASSSSGVFWFQSNSSRVNSKA